MNRKSLLLLAIFSLTVIITRGTNMSIDPMYYLLLIIALVLILIVLRPVFSSSGQTLVSWIIFGSQPLSEYPISQLRLERAEIHGLLEKKWDVKTLEKCRQKLPVILSNKELYQRLQDIENELQNRYPEITITYDGDMEPTHK